MADAERDLSGVKLGEFILRKRLTGGGWGAVYLAEQELLKREVVVKVLLSHRLTAGAGPTRFLREAQLLSQLDHPYMAHVYAFGVADELWWIAMEFVQGITLSAWLQKHGRMPLARFVPFFECIADVIHVAHERGVVHRDIKPSNIMVIELGGRLFPKVLDFGIAKVDPELTFPKDIPVGDGVSTVLIRATPRPGAYRTRTGQNREQITPPHQGIGTPSYMAPEQYRDAATVGPAADLYALGLVTYEALTGHPPFPADNAAERVWHATATTPPLGDDFPPMLDQTIRTALNKEPEQRHRNVMEMASELRAALRASEREPLRFVSQLWDDLGRVPGMLWSDDALAKFSNVSDTPKSEKTELERSFLTASQRRITRNARIRRFGGVGVALLVVGTIGGALWRQQVLKTRAAEQIAEATTTQAELERGRSALLHGEADAATHLAKAYRRDPAPATAFMLARALQPHLAEQARFTSPFGRMWSAVFSPDGEQVVTTDDTNAQIWDARSHRLGFTLAHGDTVYHAAYSADGARIFTACGDGAVRVWDAHTGTLVRELRREGRALRYRALSTSPDGKLVAAIDMTGAVAHVWDVSTGAALAELRNEAAGYPSVAFSADGKRLATSGGKDARVFDVRGWSQAVAIPRVRCMSWDPAGSHLLTGDVKGDVSIWEIPGGRRVHHLRDLGEPVTAVAYAPDGRAVVAASRDGTEQVWDVTSGELRNQSNYLHEAIRSVEFDPSSTFTIAAALNGFVTVMDTKQGMPGTPPVTILSGPRNAVVAAHFDAGARRVLGASWDGTVRIWSAGSPYRQWGSPPIANNCGVLTTLDPARRIVAINCDGQSTRVWDTVRGEMLAELPGIVPAGDDFSSALPAVSAAGDRAAVARGSTVEVYALPGGARLRTIAHGAAVNAVAFASSGLDLVTGTVDGSLLVTRDSGAQLVLPKAPAGIDVAGFLPDGQMIAADARRRLRVYDTRGTVTATFDVSARVFALRMSSDGRHVITLPRLLAKFAAPELWDVHHGRIARLDDQGQGHVWAARFVGGSVLTASADGAARRWDAQTGQLQQRYGGGTRFLAEVTLSPDGAMVVGGDAEGMLRFWDAGSGVPLWTMPAHRAALIGIHMEGDDIVTRGYSGDIVRWRLPRPGPVIEACGHNERCATVLR